MKKVICEGRKWPVAGGGKVRVKEHKCPAVSQTSSMDVATLTNRVTTSRVAKRERRL